MHKFTEGIIKFRFLILFIFVTFALISLSLIPKVEVNYDLAEYLPEDSMTKRAITVMEDEFGYPGMADVMVEDVSIQEAMNIKSILENIEGVKSVIWLDDLTDIMVPEELIPSSVLNNFYKDNCALFKIQFLENDYSLKTGKALADIREAIGDKVNISGTAEDSRYMRNVVAEEIFKITLIVFPICILILMLASSTWIEPFIYLAVIGISVAINMGTNIFTGKVSFITQSMAGVLQLAISMDYSLFLFHRYIEERDSGTEILDAIKIAVKNSLSSISASALTTIAGFLALLFMQYRIGADLGIVLAKGIILSFVTVIILMPIFIFILHKQIEKTRHKPIVPSFGKFGKLIIKLRYVIVLVLIFITIPAFLAQKNNDFLYGETSGSSTEGEFTQERLNIQNKFGIYNPVILLVPNDNIAKEISLVNDLKEKNYIRDVQALVTLADPSIPRELLPDSVKNEFLSENYSRMIVLINIDEEKPETFEVVDEIKESAQKYYSDKWLVAGKATSISDIKDSIEKDTKHVMLFSILSVGFIVLITFKSISIPILLVSVIQSSIWINMSIPYFKGTSLVYIGYLVVSSLQLGATIDYAILLSNRYMEFRRKEKPKQAAIMAIKTAGISVTVSALILSVAGFTEGFVSRIPSVSEIGILLGRGAMLSGILVLLLLPVLLVMFDKIIMKTTLGTKDIN